MPKADRPTHPEDFAFPTVSAPRLLALRAKSAAPRLVELARPRRYAANHRLVKRLQSDGYTMLGGRRARNLIECARQVDRRGIPGAIVDCGVWNGGSTILLGMGAPERAVWAFDSFEGLPKPGPRDRDAHEEWAGVIAGSEEMLREGFARFAGRIERLHVVKGWFDVTLPGTAPEIDEVAVLAIDADWYDSVRLALEHFYDKVSPGGYVLVDDLRVWQGARDATNEFRQRAGVRDPIKASHYWRKSGRPVIS